MVKICKPKLRFGKVGPECDKYLFLTEHKYQILFGFQKTPSTEYRLLLGNEKIRIPNADFYSVLRKSEYPIQIVLFGQTIQIPNTKFLIVYKNFGRKSN